MTASYLERKKDTRLLRRWITVVVMLLGIVVGYRPTAVAESFDEYRVKAVFLYNLAQFVNWPDAAFQSTNQTFVIGILGKDPFGGELARVISNDTLHGRRVNVIYYKDIDSLVRRPCQMIFVNLDEKTLLKELYETLGGLSILTVSDHDGFAHRGGMINLYIAGNRIQLEINMDNTRRAGLQISAKLLSLAHLIDSSR